MSTGPSDAESYDLQSYASVVFTIYAATQRGSGTLNVSWSMSRGFTERVKLSTDVYSYDIPAGKSYTIDVPVRAQWMSYTNKGAAGGTSTTKVVWVPKYMSTYTSLGAAVDSSNGGHATSVTIHGRSQGAAVGTIMAPGGHYGHITNVQGSDTSGLCTILSDASGIAIGVTNGLLNVVDTNISGMPQASWLTLTGTGFATPTSGTQSLGYTLADNSGIAVTSTRTAASSAGRHNALYVTMRNAAGQPVSSTHPVRVTQVSHHGKGYTFDKAITPHMTTVMTLNETEGYGVNLYSLQVTNPQATPVWLKLYDIYETAAFPTNLEFGINVTTLKLNLAIPGESTRDFQFEKGIFFKHGIVARTNADFAYDTSYGINWELAEGSEIYITGNYTATNIANDGVSLKPPSMPQNPSWDFVLGNLSAGNNDISYGGWTLVSYAQASVFVGLKYASGLGGNKNIDVSVYAIWGQGGSEASGNTVSVNIPLIPPLESLYFVKFGDTGGTEGLGGLINTIEQGQGPDPDPAKLKSLFTWPSRVSVKVGGVESASDFPLPGILIAEDMTVANEPDRTNNVKRQYEGFRFLLGDTSMHGLASAAADQYGVATGPFDQLSVTSINSHNIVQMDVSTSGLPGCIKNPDALWQTWPTPFLSIFTPDISASTRYVLIDSSCRVADVKLSTLSDYPNRNLPQSETSNAVAYFDICLAEGTVPDVPTGLITPAPTDAVYCFSTPDFRGSIYYDDSEHKYNTSLLFYHNNADPTVMYEYSNSGAGIYESSFKTNSYVDNMTTLYSHRQTHLSSTMDVSSARIYYTKAGTIKSLDSSIMNSNRQFLHTTDFSNGSLFVNRVIASAFVEETHHFYRGHQHNNLVNGDLYCEGVKINILNKGVASTVAVNTIHVSPNGLIRWATLVNGGTIHLAYVKSNLGNTALDIVGSIDTLESVACGSASNNGSLILMLYEALYYCRPNGSISSIANVMSPEVTLGIPISMSLYSNGATLIAVTSEGYVVFGNIGVDSKGQVFVQHGQDQDQTKLYYAQLNDAPDGPPSYISPDVVSTNIKGNIIAFCKNTSSTIYFTSLTEFANAISTHSLKVTYKYTPPTSSDWRCTGLAVSQVGDVVLAAYYTAAGPAYLAVIEPFNGYTNHIINLSSNWQGAAGRFSASADGRAFRLSPYTKAFYVYSA